MNILVVGAEGGLGQALLEQAVARGHNVAAFMRDAQLPAFPGWRTAQ